MNYSPIETEYNGEIFRSKTEAVFARCLDLLGALWVYEPTLIPDMPYKPDFEVAMKCKIAGCTERVLTNWLIEIKPEIPTDSYLKKLGSDFDEICQGGYKQYQMLIAISIKTGLFLGCFIRDSDTNEWVESEKTEAWGRHFCTHLQEAKRFRFDLKHRIS